MALLPDNMLPPNYRIDEYLMYFFGGGICFAFLSLHLYLPRTQLCISIQDRYLPEERDYPKTASDYPMGLDGLPFKWLQDSAQVAPMVRAKIGTSLRKDWRKRARGGSAIGITPHIVINEKTTEQQIWGQLLLSAWIKHYFNSVGQIEAYKELITHFPSDTLNKLLMHLEKHPLLPYEANSSLAYLKSLSRLFTMTHNQESQHFLYGDTEKADDNLSNAVLRYSPKGVFRTSLETGIPRRTIYQLIKEGKIQAENSNSDVITLSDDTIDKLQKRAEKQRTRKAIFEYAKLKGKSSEATKKWLQRHQDLPEDEFKNELSLWLELDRPSKQS
ncbi:hypothetical protein ACFLXU_05535 [Chloroflexota bacterium]